jgi:4'-phosphopantetheinyl transferase
MSSDRFWAIPPEEIALASGEVHVWRASLDMPAVEAERLLPLLSADEQRRAGDYARPELRRAFLVARGVLRTLLGRYLGLKADEVRLAYNAHGRPELGPELRGAELRFNLSHSGSVVLYAFTRNREVGIDVERPGRRLEFEPLARRFFSPHEAETLLALPDAERRAAFFRCWTRKEAFIKATGRGLSYGLSRFDVSLGPNEPARLLRAAFDDPSAWSMRDLPAGTDYAAALVVEGHAWTLRAWQWGGAEDA